MTPTALDPETCLRLAFERHLLSSEGRPFAGGELSLVGRVLVAGGALPRERAVAVFEEYGDALAIRPAGAGFLRRGPRPAAPPAGRRLGAARVARCAVALPDERGRTLLERVLLTEEHAVLSLSGVIDPGTPASRLSGWRRPPGPARPPMLGTGGTCTVEDASGTVATASHRSSGSSDRSWHCELVTDVPLAMDTRFLLVAGRRVELPPAAPPPAVRLEPAAAPGDPLRALLYRELFESRRPRPGGSGVPAALDALEATGVLAEGDQLRAELAAAGGLTAAGPPPAAGGAPPPAPLPWSSLLGRLGREDGPVGELALGCAVELGDCSVRLDALRSEPDGFLVDVAAAPGTAILAGLPFRGLDLDPTPVEWWAEDDRANAYLGVPSRWQGGDDLAEGAVGFAPCIDPAASELRLIVVAAGRRAVVEVPLARLRAGGGGSAPTGAGR